MVNPKWLDGIMRHGYKGGLELAATVDYLFGYDATAGVVDDWMYDQVAETYALIAAMQDFLRQSNPWALHAISERLLEAAERGLWAEPSPEILAALRDTFRASEAMLEQRSETRRPAMKPALTPMHNLMHYPFTALVGQDQLKTALLVNAVDPRIGGVLICGEKGTAKSTAARSPCRVGSAAASRGRLPVQLRSRSAWADCPHCSVLDHARSDRAVRRRL